MSSMVNLHVVSLISLDDFIHKPNKEMNFPLIFFILL
jgi:hypothetical protein